MLPRANRLAKTTDFDRAFKHGRSSYDKIIGVKLVKNDLTVNRFGVIINLKVSKLAVKRNLLKRRLLDIVAKGLTTQRQGFDVIIICLPGSSDLEYDQLAASLTKRFSDLNLI